MASNPSKRYKLSRQIGTGDFATVYAATDLKLSREVAIKKIHPQFLNDEQKLANYWKEAQLLGSLEHPNIMTIYDVVKNHGSLVLELMQGSLKQIYAGRAMPVDDVRQMLLQAANGLHNLHSNGIIHGDIKPGNLLLSRQNLVKLGDFGLARRASDSDGSLLKGAAKYMAPELVSDQFGPVRPASDLYSLGFSALELMCGPDYDSLFPELHAFGRDQQMAWMMWHCSADRRLPPINTMLEDVPDDLAAVLQKLTTKNQKQRYQSAAQVINDLNSGGGASQPIGESLKQEVAEEELLKKQKKRKRLVAIGMFVASLAMCTALLLIPEKKELPPPEVVVEKPLKGVIQTVFAVHEKLVIDLAASEGENADTNADAGKGWKELTLYEEDRIFLNRKERQLRDLKEGDRVVVTKMMDANQKPFREISAFRPETRSASIKSIQLDEGKFTLGDKNSDENDLILNVPVAVPMTVNNQEKVDGQAIKLEQLQVGDDATVEFVEQEFGFQALAVDARRVVQGKGVIRDISLQKNRLTIVSDDSNGKLVSLPFADQCLVTLNNMRTLNEQLLKPKDLRPGDKVSIKYDTKIVSVDAERMFSESGTISQIDYATRTVSVKSDDGATIVCVVPQNATLSLGTESVQLTDLRRNDTVEFRHDAPGDKTPEIISMAATRPPEDRKWALLVANQNFDDGTLTPLSTPLEDARSLRDRMISRFAVPEDQTILLEDESRVRLEQAIPEFLNRVPANAQLFVYLNTHAYTDAPPDSKELTGVYFAPKDFAFKRVADTGINLDWLVGLIESSKPAQKMLLLDCTQPGDGADLSLQPSTEKMVEIIRRGHQGGYPESTFVLTSCSEGERGSLSSKDPEHGFFGLTLADAFNGAADDGFDNKIDFTELSKYVLATAKASGTQTPRLFLPDDTPPRLTDAAKDAVRRLLLQFTQRKLDADSVRAEAEQVNKLANGEPEAFLAGAMLMLKAGDRQQTIELLEQVRLTHPDIPLTYQLLAWVHFDLRDFSSGQNMLKLLTEKIPVEAEYDEATLALFEWIGRLRELGARADWSPRKASATVTSAIDAAIAAHGEMPKQRYEAGRKIVVSLFEQYDKQIAESPGDELKINLKRRSLKIYASFATEPAMAFIRANLDR